MMGASWGRAGGAEWDQSIEQAQATMTRWIAWYTAEPPQ